MKSQKHQTEPTTEKMTVAEDRKLPKESNIALRTGIKAGYGVLVPDALGILDNAFVTNDD